MKSQEEFYLCLHTLLVRCDPLELSLSDKKSLVRDLKTIQSRVRYEGLSFLTKSLPLLGKALDQGLVSGKLNVPRCFKKASGTASRPALLQAYFSLVFDKDGSLLDVVSVESIKHLRQILYFAYKLEIPSTSLENKAIIAEFVKVDCGLELLDNPLATDIVKLAKIITRKVFHDFDHKDILPRHGPGAVATGERLEDKWLFSRLYNSIHQVYPYYEYFVVGGARELSDRLDWYKSLRRLESGTAKVVLVPKDSRGPRLISCEPLEYQWIQQGLGRKMSDFLEWTSPYTKGHVNFTFQEKNRNIAKASSASQNYATLDLKDASDRVSLELVRRVFSDSPNLLRGLEACRSTGTKLPDGSIITLRKFAPMGSALCFPVEAYLFWVIIVSAIVREHNLPLEMAGKRVFVYGDDIIVPTKWAALSIQALESVGLKVNRDKSCTSGFFRESCGMDAYNGIDVTPSRLRTLWSSSGTDGSSLASYTSLANLLADKGYIEASDFIWKELEKVFGYLPYGTSRSSFPCRVVKSAMCAIVLNKRLHRSRWSKKYQRIEFLLPSLSSRRIRSKLDGWPRLLRNEVTPPFSDPSVIVVPRSMKIKRGWAAVF